MSTRPGSTHAFTLLELLVVVAVLGLLLAILMPALSAASEAGRSAVCGTNLNQLGIGAFAYTEQNDDRLPWYGWAGPPEGQEWWIMQIARTLEQFEPEIYRCPSDPLPKPIAVNLGGANGFSRSFRRISVKVSYRGACDLIIPTAADSTLYSTVYVPRRITSWTRPEMAIQLIEGNPTPTYSPAMNPSNQQSCYRTGALSNMAKGRYNESWERHFGTTNILFMDGHVANLIPSQIGLIAKQQEHRL